MWNNDKTGLMMEHNNGNVICLKGKTLIRKPEVNIVAGDSATGVRLPPLYIFAGQRWRDDLFDGSSYALLFLGHDSYVKRF
ncbi:hypothetical protein DPMN_071638 [Dreissena polymorpha]|uniref:Uncharacterized protein n=1 Tax=Dreissena polymorpha TaxID=45954 RepID=A0A9D4BWF2_DREPO|nr:hypothetical protein DPMN_071638 [Dreissena polymorpha]